MLKWNFGKLSTVKLETNEHEIREDFQDISVKTDTADIFFLPSADGVCRVECEEEVKANHAVSVQNGTLLIEVVNEKAWYDYINFSFVSPKITVYLPRAEYHALAVETSTGDIQLPKDFSFQSMDVRVNTGDVRCYASATEEMKIKTTTGGIWVENLSAGSLELSVSTGKVTATNVLCDGALQIGVSTGKTTLSNIQCRSLTSTGDTGDISLKHVIATEALSIERDTGDVRFEDSDAASIHIKTSTGDVTGTLLSEKHFVAKTSTGHVDVPKTTTGGNCEITTSTGDIKIRISKS